MGDWTMTALKFMGDGQKSVSQLMMDVSKGELPLFLTRKRELRQRVGQNATWRAWLNVGFKLDQVMSDFTRPFGQLRYVTALLPEMTLDQFQTHIAELGKVYDDMVELIRAWNATSEQILKGKIQAPPPIAPWEKQAADLERRLLEQRQALKIQIAIEKKVEAQYRTWDECLAKHVRSRDTEWKSLSKIAVEMKQDAFSDIDRWRTELKKWRDKIRASAAPQHKEILLAGTVLESYCKMKHLQKVLALW